MVGHEDGIRHCYERLAQPQGLKDTPGAGVADDQSGAAHVLSQRGHIVEGLHSEAIGQPIWGLPIWQQEARCIAAGSHLHITQQN